MPTISKRKHSVLITSSNFPDGGAGAAYLNLFCKGMMLNGHDIKVFLTRGHAFGESEQYLKRKNVTPEGVVYKYLGLSRRPVPVLLKLADDLLSFSRLLAFLVRFLFTRTEKRIFIYHIDFLHGLIIYPAAKVLGVKIITFVPEYFDRGQFKGLRNRLRWINFIVAFDYLIPLSEKLIVFSFFLRDVFIIKGFDPEKIFIQPNLTDFDFWTSCSETEKYTIGYSGTPGKKDGLLDLFRAISLIKDRYPVTLLVVGDITFGVSMIPELQKECESLNIKDRVFFTGLLEYDKVREYLSMCRILAITRPLTIQTRAGFPTKIGEYMALGKPVLATNFGDLGKYFSDKKDILIAECENPVSIAEKLEWMISNPEQTGMIAKSGRIKAIDTFEYAASVKRMSEFFDL
jgi:glycosyltransferase involved in cell wall biosynthesis